MQVKKVVIATHYLNYGASHALRDYLLKKDNYDILFIALPFFTQRNTIIEEYSQKKLISEKRIVREKDAGLKAYFTDVVQVIQTVLQKKKKYDMFIGVNNLNCLSGLLLKKANKAKRVIYYSIDFVPIRFQNKILNSIYHSIEAFCVKHADEVWNVSPRIAEGREKFLHINAKKFKQKVVPIGVWNEQVYKLPFSEMKKHQLLFMGHLLKKQGVQKVIEAIPQILQKIPDFSLFIIGDGEYKRVLQQLVKKYKVTRSVRFSGWVQDRKKIDKMMSESAAAVAVYEPEKDRLYNFTYFADPTKIKDYLSAGLPIILTDVPYNAQEIEKKRCGIIVQYDKNQIANAVLSILTDSKTLQTYRANALSYAKEFEWSKIFSKLNI